MQLVSLPGHSKGHAGVAVRTDAGWLLHAGDAIMFLSELDPSPSMPSGGRAFQWFFEQSQARRRRTLRRLRDVVASWPEIEVICTHDPSLI